MPWYAFHSDDTFMIARMGKQSNQGIVSSSMPDPMHALPCLKVELMQSLPRVAPDTESQKTESQRTGCSTPETHLDRTGATPSHLQLTCRAHCQPVLPGCSATRPASTCRHPLWSPCPGPAGHCKSYQLWHAPWLLAILLNIALSTDCARSPTPSHAGTS